MRDLLEVGALGQRLHALGGSDRLLPVFFLLVDLQQETQRLKLERTPIELVEQLLRAIEEPRAMKVLGKLEYRGLSLVRGEIGSIDQILVHADGTVDLALPAEQVPQRKVQVDRLRIDLDDFDE